MAPTLEPSLIKNKMKREEMARKAKKAKGQRKLERRLAQAKLEAKDPAAKKVRERDSAMLKILIWISETTCRKCTTHTRQYARV